LESRELAEKIVSILEEKKAKDLNIIDIREISILADYFVICSGTSTTHIKTLADEVEEKMLEAGIELLHKEGYNSARWILLDYGEVFYNLERLWAVMKHRQ